MKLRRIIRIIEILIVGTLLLLGLLDVLELITALIIIIAIQLIIGNIVYPIIYKLYFDKFVNVIKTYNVDSFDEQTYSNQLLDVESKQIHSKFYIIGSRAIVMVLSVNLGYYIISFLLGYQEHFDSFLIFLLFNGLAPIFLFVIYKTLRFPCNFNENEIVGYFKSNLDPSVQFIKDKVDFSTINSISLIENKLIDHLGYITIVDFGLNDGNKKYLNLLYYSKKNRDKILDTLKQSLVLAEKETI